MLVLLRFLVKVETYFNCFKIVSQIRLQAILNHRIRHRKLEARRLHQRKNQGRITYLAF
jgi:hypothetical protein